ncbi:hypothetical protein EAF00_001071 [Botryotinia globosa]|nr:hypothetical protein EAF00_001071 [Botryotinia globosa]
MDSVFSFIFGSSYFQSEVTHTTSGNSSHNSSSAQSSFSSIWSSESQFDRAEAASFPLGFYDW